MTNALLDTSVVIDPPTGLPGITLTFISSITLGELAAGVHAARTGAERARRLSRLQELENAIDTLPFGGPEARVYGEPNGGRVRMLLRACDQGLTSTGSPGIRSL